jgi:YegS/Rv2252/BmrU family lipid kinase
MSVAVIINPIAGAAPRPSPDVRARVAAAAVAAHGDAADVFVTERPGHARELAKGAVARGARLIIAWGGDGTLNEAACALAFSDVPLGIVPSGSGNGLATELGISRVAERAIAQALSAAPRRIDLGEIGGRLFVNLAGIGIDAYVAAQFDRGGPSARGLLAYARVTGRALFTYTAERYRIATSSQRLETRALLIGIANGTQFGNNARIAPAARLDDGLLDLVVVDETSRLRTLRHVPRLFNGKAALVPGYRSWRVDAATIECDRPMAFHVDGEPVLGGTSLAVRVHPAALWVAAPARAPLG